jgi:glyoxylase-like metal-dependent hydrolase (beta-lactamase superfamily II)
MKLSEGLHRIGNDIVAVHLIVTDEGLTLIDAGLVGHYADLRRELTAIGRPLSDIRGIVLTHGDTDHTGFAERLRKELDIPVYVGAGDAARAQGEKPPKMPKEKRRIGPVIKFFAYAISKGGIRMPSVSEVVSVNDGDVLPLPGAPEILGMPGHSPGSIAIHVPVADAIFVGDAMTTRHVLTGQRGPQPAPFTEDPHRALASLRHLEGVQASWVLPGHGTPWSGGVAEAIRAIRTVAGT